MKQKGFSLIIFLILAVLITAGYFAYKNFWPNVSALVSPQNYEECLKSPGSVLQTSYPSVCVTKSGASFTEPLGQDGSSPIPYVPGEPVISVPQNGSKITSPLTVKGTVPSGWMFEGVFPIKLVDADNKVVAQGQAKELVPGTWQSGTPVDFTATLTFTGFTGTGSLILENDNPSGDPSKSKSFSLPVSINCTPRPKCLDATPKCMIPETEGMCSKSTTWIACTQEAKLCPDGTYVGRTGPNCEFTPCPGN